MVAEPRSFFRRICRTGRVFPHAVCKASVDYNSTYSNNLKDFKGSLQYVLMFAGFGIYLYCMVRGQNRYDRGTWLIIGAVLGLFLFAYGFYLIVERDEARIHQLQFRYYFPTISQQFTGKTIHKHLIINQIKYLTDPMI